MSNEPKSADGNGDVIAIALRPEQAARALNIGRRKLWELTNCNDIPHVRLGRCVVYPVDQLKVWLAEQAKRAKR